MTRLANHESRILFIHNGLTPFVEIDRDLLRERWDVQERYEASRLINPVSLVSSVFRCDLVFCWFASWHSILPVLFARWLGKPSVVVIGGYDTANLPESQYGSQRGGTRRLITNTVIRNTTCLIAMSQAACQEAISNAKADLQKITVVYQGIDLKTQHDLIREDSLILTVGGVWRENLMRKGLLPFIQTAAYLPDKHFVLVGRWYDDSIDDLKRAAGPNVEFKGHLSDYDLSVLYASAGVYVQASLHEGFGMSLAEAMLAGCVPVVTRAGALPEVVGVAGVYANSNQPADLAAAIREALERKAELGPLAQRRIAETFPLARRRDALHELIRHLLVP